MRDFRFNIIYVLCLSVCLCCTEKSIIKENIDIDNLTSVSIFDLFESLDVIQLETNDECLISTIAQVLFYDNRYYVFDIRQQGLFCFDTNGKFLFKIFRKGQGPEEYLYLCSITIDSFNEQLLLLEPFGNLLAFSLDGNFISKTRLPMEIMAYNEVYPLNKDTLLFISLNRYSLLLYEKKTNLIIDNKYESDNKYLLLSPINKTYSYNNQLFFSIPLTNDILNLNDNSFFTWNFGKKNNTKKQIKNVTREINREKDPFVDFVEKRLLNYYFIYNYETARYKICMLRYGNNKYRNLYFDKTLNKPIIFDKTIEGIQFITSYYNNNSIILTEEHYKYKYYDESILTEQQREIINSRNEYDNPFLVKYNFKK